MNAQQSVQFMQDLYKAVDSKDLDFLNQHLSENIKFRIANSPTIDDKQLALDANKNFFSSIESMAHTLDKIIVQGENLVCYGTVNYARLNGSKYSAYFSTFLTIVNDQIEDYLVFADVSDL